MAKVQFINFCIGKFAEAFRMTPLVAYRYLSTYGGLRFLDECYAAEHLLSADDAVEDLAKVCRRNGGSL